MVERLPGCRSPARRPPPPHLSRFPAAHIAAVCSSRVRRPRSSLCPLSSEVGNVFDQSRRPPDGSNHAFFRSTPQSIPCREEIPGLQEWRKDRVRDCEMNCQKFPHGSTRLQHSKRPVGWLATTLAEVRE